MVFSIDTILIVISGCTFFAYGTLCLTTNHMMAEFTRYGLLQYRTLTGILELLGGLGSLIGVFYYKPILLLSMAGLTILMLMGVVIRLRIKDPYLFILPAFILMIMNAVLFYRQL
jgi:hypothetical protein